MLIKVQFLREGKPAGRRYTYKTALEVKEGDLVMAGRDSVAQVVETDVPEEEGAVFGDRLKSIDVRYLPAEDAVSPDVPLFAEGKPEEGKEAALV